MIRRYLSTEVALLLSLMLHALAFGTWQYRQVLGQLPLFHQLARLLSAYSSPVRQSNAHAPTTITFVQTPSREPEPPRTFMETDESQVTGEQPKDAKYYSDRSTVAANPVNPTDKEGETPYLEGTETRMMSTETVSPRPGAGASQAPPSAPAPAIPASPPPAPPAPPASKVKNDASIEQPKPGATKVTASEGLKVVEEQKVAMAPKEIAAPPPSLPPMPATPATPSSGSSSKREIGASKSRLVATGISRYGIAAFNVEESPFGAYDKGIIRAVQSRWYALIEQNGLYERSGQVTLHFKLMPDGTVQNDEHGHPLMKQEENTAGLVLASFCELAILQSAPFTPLPEKLRMLIGNEPREVNFTFYY